MLSIRDSRQRLLVLPVVCLVTVTAVSGEQQYFRLRPSNVSVSEGKTAILRCEVELQGGQLQWTKQGFALGYTRGLPGYPRYRMLGDEKFGVHNLEVRNATLADEGRFQCQVSPEEEHQAIKSDAFLSVLLRPRSVRLNAEVGGQPFVNKVEVKEGTPVTFICQVNGARPAADVIWKKNGRKITSAGRSEMTVAASSDDRRFDATATLRLEPQAVDDRTVISCVASHPTLPADGRKSVVGRISTGRAVYNASMRLSVLHPPGPPAVTDYIEGKPLHIGEKHKLSCESLGGNPPASVRWYKDDRPVTSTQVTRGDLATTSYSFIVDVTDLPAIYRCVATSPVQKQPQEVSIRLNVIFGPRQVWLSGAKEVGAGASVQLTCQTSVSNPAANLTWTIDETPAPSNASQSTSIKGPPSEGGERSVSVLTWIPAEDIGETVKFVCSAHNRLLGKVGSAKVVLPKLRAAGKPTITGYNSSRVIAGQVVTLTCATRGGHPAPDLEWKSEGVILQSERRVTGQVAEAKLAITLKPQDNGRILTCFSHNSMMEAPDEAAVTLTVHFGPEELRVSSTPDRLEAGGHAELTCESSASLPAAELSWWKDGEQIRQHLLGEDTIPAGNYGGLRTRSVIRWPLSWRDDGAVFQCRASTSLTSAVLTLNHTLSVLHAPKFHNLQSTIEAREGESIVMNFTARGNPTDIVYWWSRDLSDDVIRLEHGLLRFASLLRHQGGVYRLQAQNSVGKTEARIRLEVLYPPVILESEDTIVVRSGSNTTLSCTLDANPLLSNMVTWTSEDVSLATVSFSYFNNTSFLNIANMSSRMVGYFWCNVKNTLGLDTKRFGLAVEEPASVDSSTRLRKSAVVLGETAYISCRAHGSPSIGFVWTRNRKQILIGDQKRQDSRLKIRQQQVDVMTWISVLVLSDARKSDLGPYNCSVSNPLGRDSLEVQLVLPFIPDPPEALRALNMSATSVTFSWTPGFDGGFMQGFRFRICANSTGKCRLRDADPDTYNYTVTDLQPAEAFLFQLAAYNQLGVSSFTAPPLLVNDRHKNSPPLGYVTDRDDVDGVTSHSTLLISVIAVACTVVFVLNVLILRHRLVNCRNKRSENEEALTVTRNIYSNRPDSDIQICTNTNAAAYLHSKTTEMAEGTGTSSRYSSSIPLCTVHRTATGVSPSLQSTVVGHPRVEFSDAGGAAAVVSSLQTTSVHTTSLSRRRPAIRTSHGASSERFATIVSDVDGIQLS